MDSNTTRIMQSDALSSLWDSLPIELRVGVLPLEPGVLPFLHVKDIGMFNAITSNPQDREYLINSYKGASLPAFDKYIYTDANDFSVLRGVLRLGVDLGALRLEVNGFDSGCERDWTLVELLHLSIDIDVTDIAALYMQKNAEVGDSDIFYCVHTGEPFPYPPYEAMDVEWNEDEEWPGRESTTLMCAIQHGHVAVVKALVATLTEGDIADYPFEHNQKVPICLASAHGHLEIVQTLIAAGADVSQTEFEYDRTPLHEAVLHSHLDVVQELLRAGADYNSFDVDDDTPFMLALEEAICEEIVGALVVGWAGADRSSNKPLFWVIGADSFGDYDEDGDEHTPHDLCLPYETYFDPSFCRNDTVRALIAAGVDVNKADNDGETPISRASRHGHLEVVQALIAAGADVMKASDEGRVPLHEAVDNGHFEVVLELIAGGAGVDVNTPDEDGTTPFTLALANEECGEKILPALIQAWTDVDKSTNAPLFWVIEDDESKHLCREYRNDTVRALIKAGVDVNMVNEADGDCVTTPLIEAIRSTHLGIVQQLVAAGADMEKADEDGSTPILWASYKSDIKIVRFLCDAGVDENKADNNGTTSMYWASHNCRSDIVKALSRADVNRATNDGSTPLIEASSRGSSMVVQLLIEKGASVDKANDDGDTPIYWAAHNGQVVIVQILIYAGADVNKADGKGATPIYRAARNGHLEVVNALIAANADVNKADDDGGTPVLWASRAGHPEVVHTLIAAGADLNKADNDGCTPVLLAAEWGRIAPVNNLIVGGADVDKEFAQKVCRTSIACASSEDHL
jgi:ankyrin repeat protein